MRKVLYVTGSRADYGLMRNVLKRIDSDDQLELSLAVMGMHLMPEYDSIVEIQNDGFRHYNLDIKQLGGNREAMSIFCAQCTSALTKLCMDIQPDIILLLGDRAEMMAGAIVGTYLGIVTAHIHGGEVSSTVDESIRHAITKLSHLHFAASEDSVKRLLRLGEKAEHVFETGAPGLDGLTEQVLPYKQLCRELRLPDSSALILILYHPVSEEIDEAGEQMKNVLQSTSKLDGEKIIVYPNADAGRDQVVNVIESYKERSDFHIYGHIKRNQFVSLLKYAKVMIGNSSSGLIEAPTFELPVVNVGTRQSGRLRGTNVIDSDCQEDMLISSLQKALSIEFKEFLKGSINPYGDGKATDRIVHVLKNMDLNKEILQKKITY